MLKKTLAIAALSLISLSFLVFNVNAAEEDIIADLDNTLPTELEEEISSDDVLEDPVVESETEPISGDVEQTKVTIEDSTLEMEPDSTVETLSDNADDKGEVRILMPDMNVDAIPDVENDMESEPASSETEGMMEPEESADSGHSSDWEYSGEGAPENWGNLSEEYKLCKVGEMQSPIDLDTAQFNSQTPIHLDYAVTTFEVVNNGHSIQVNYPKGSTATIGEDIYDLLQLHFHTPSEHSINGEHAEMEVHLVHANNAGEIAVIGSMIKAGDESYDVTKIWRNIPALGESRRSGLVLNPQNFISETMTHATYLGSLTTPPCSENVNWVVMAEPITLSQEQIETFQSLYPMDARPIQR